MPVVARGRFGRFSDGSSACAAVPGQAAEFIAGAATGEAGSAENRRGPGETNRRRAQAVISRHRLWQYHGLRMPPPTDETNQRQA